MAHKFFEEKRAHNGLTYTEYMKNTIEEIENTNTESLNEKDKKTLEYKKLNLQRSTRIEKHYTPSVELKEIIESISEPQLWMVITENWCGDSAQNLPYIAAAAALNPKINFRIILRDSNPDIMDLYLTNGNRSIPKLVVFDEEGNELFQWGPRPKAAQDLFINLKNDGTPKLEIYEKLHLWYGRNRGAEIEKELIELVKKEELAK